MCESCRKIQPQIDALTRRLKAPLTKQMEAVREVHHIKALLLNLLLAAECGDQLALEGAAGLMRAMNTATWAIDELRVIREAQEALDATPLSPAEQLGDAVAQLEGDQLQVMLDGMKMLTGWVPRDVSRETFETLVAGGPAPHHPGLTHTLDSLLWASGLEDGQA